MPGRYASWEEYARFFVQMSMALDAVMAYSLFTDSKLLLMIDWPVAHHFGDDQSLYFWARVAGMLIPPPLIALFSWQDGRALWAFRRRALRVRRGDSRLVSRKVSRD